MKDIHFLSSIQVLYHLKDLESSEQKRFLEKLIKDEAEIIKVLNWIVPHS